MIPYFVIGGPYVAGWGCAGEESRRSCNMFDKHRRMQGQNIHVHTYLHTHTHTHLCSVSVSLRHTLFLCLAFSRSHPAPCFHIPPSRPIGGNNFSPENKHGTLITFLISDPAAFRNITLSLCTVTVTVMI